MAHPLFAGTRHQGLAIQTVYERVALPVLVGHHPGDVLAQGWQLLVRAMPGDPKTKLSADSTDSAECAMDSAFIEDDDVSGLTCENRSWDLGSG